MNQVKLPIFRVHPHKNAGKISQNRARMVS
jgi:hypothetical protein